jgi:hypothetical protein
MNAKFECPQCRYKYSLSRLNLSKLLNGRWLAPAITLLLFSVIWAIGVFTSFVAVNVGLLAPTGSRDSIWTHQNMLSSLAGVGALGLLYGILADGFAMFAMFNMHCVASPRSLCSILLAVGLVRVVAGIYDAATAAASRARGALRQHVLDIRHAEARPRCRCEPPAR